MSDWSTHIKKITTSIRIHCIRKHCNAEYIAYTLFIIIYIDDSFYTSSHDVIWGACFSRTHFWWNHSRQPLKTSDAAISNINSSTTVKGQKNYVYCSLIRLLSLWAFPFSFSIFFNGSMFGRKFFFSMYWTSHLPILLSL